MSLLDDDYYACSLRGGVGHPEVVLIIASDVGVVPPEHARVATWLQATDSVRSSTNSFSTQNMFEVILANHAVEVSELLGTQRFDRVHSRGACSGHC